MSIVASILAGTSLPSAVKSDASAYDALTLSPATGKRMPFLGSSTKISAGTAYGVLGTVLYMVPAGGSGTESCASATDGCRAACLAEGTGRMSMSGPQTARRRKHAAFLADRGRFLADLNAEIAKHERKAKRQNKVPAVRLNGTTDLPWHRMRFTDHRGVTHKSVIHANPNVSFYEYTKHPLSIATKGGVPANLHFTYSMNDRAGSDDHAANYLDAGYGAAVVLSVPRHDVPSTYAAAGRVWQAHDGDAHDARFLDPVGSVTILAAKGNAKHDTTGFVRPDPRIAL